MWLLRQSLAEGSWDSQSCCRARAGGMCIFSLLPSVSSKACASHTQPEGSCVPEAQEISYLTDSQTLSRKVLREAANTPASSDEGES